MQKGQVLDGVLIAYDLIDVRKKSRKATVILKIEMEKDHDHAEWGFGS